MTTLYDPKAEPVEVHKPQKPKGYEAKTGPAMGFNKFPI